MSVARQLYQLQEIDLELEANEQALKEMTSQLGESQAVADAQNRLVSECQRLEESKRQQQSLEWEIDDLVAKINDAQRKLFGGSIRNPKELSNLQQDVESLRSKRSQLEDKALEIMEQVERTEANTASRQSDLKRLEAESQSRQQQLSTNIAELKANQSELKHKREALSARIDPETIRLYDTLKRNKGTALARVEQGICGGCRISLSSAEIQQSRSGRLVQCSTCGRILFLA
jgi:hypothetical protein